MIRKSSLLAAGVTVVTAALMSACAVLKTPPPVQTYRFGSLPAFTGSAASGQCQKVVPLALRNVSVVDAARGDRILTVTGNETAHIGGARWVSLAETLFRDSLEDGLAAGAPCVRLTMGPGRDGLSLSVDVRRLETVYAYAGAVPDVKLVAVAQLSRANDRSIVDTLRLDISETAAENRVSAIVQAYDQVNVDAVRQIVEWTAAQAAAVS